MKIDKETGLVSQGKLNQVVEVIVRRPDGSIRRQTDFQYCPTMAEQHTAHVTDINYLIDRYKPDELAAYIAARGAHKQEIIGHDFSIEPNLQEARNITYKLKQAFDELPSEIKNNFRNHVEFLKFIDNPANQEKMIKMGLLTKKEIQKHVEPANEKLNNDQQNPPASDETSIESKKKK